MSSDTHVNALARRVTACITSLRSQRFVNGTLEYVSNGRTRQEPLIFALEPVENSRQQNERI